MIVHNLKIKYCFAELVALGFKTFELRKDDRNYQVGDYLAFDVIDIPEAVEVDKNIRSKVNANLNILNRNLYKITYKLKGVPEYGLDEAYCILGIKPIEIEKPTGIIMEEIK